MQDNGPGIVKKQIPLIFGKLLYGSKFHRLRQSRGQQGIGISAAGMYGVQTTGKPVKIISKVGAEEAGPLLRDSDRHQEERAADSQRPRRRRRHSARRRRATKLIDKHGIEWVDQPHGTRVTIELQAKFMRGRGSVDEYLEQTAIANPHVTLHYIDPDGDTTRLSALGRQAAAGAEGDQAASVRRRAGPADRRCCTDSRSVDGRAVSDDDVLARHRPVARKICDTAKISHAVEHAADRPQGSRRAVPGDSGDADRLAGDRLHLARSARS